MNEMMLPFEGVHVDGAVNTAGDGPDAIGESGGAKTWILQPESCGVFGSRCCAFP
jgi:hypothetical protein